MLLQVCTSEGQHSSPLTKIKGPAGWPSLVKALEENLFPDSSFKRPPAVPGAWSVSPSAEPEILPLSERVSVFKASCD